MMLKSTALLIAGAIACFAGDHKIHKVLFRDLTADEGATAPAFVVFGERPDLSPARRMGRVEQGEFVIRSLKETATRSQAAVQGFLRGKRVDFQPFWIENKILIRAATIDLVRDLSRMPAVVAILPDEVYAMPKPSTEAAIAPNAVQWNISRVGADQVWSQYSTKGTGMVVASIDTGVQHTHPAIANQYRGLTVSGYSHAGNWFDPTGTCGATPCDNNGHGTHTVGTMVGDDGGSNQIGVAPGAKWIGCKGCGTSSCASSSLTSCAQWIVDPTGDGKGTGRPDAVNNSWGGGGGSSWYRTYVSNWRAAGIFPAFSNGNSGPNCQTSGSPGDYLESFSSGASDSSDNIASFSSRGPSAFGGIIKPDLTAPGAAIRSSVPNNGYANYSGTSMASPHTAAAAALLWAVQPALRGKIAETENFLRTTAIARTDSQTCGGVSGGAVPNNTYGYGILNVKRAADAASGPVNQAPVVTITAPANGSAFDCGTTITFTATANDAEEGNLDSGLSWSLGGQSASGPTVTRSFACTQTGFQTITARVQDSQLALDSDSITVNIVDPNQVNAPSNLAASVSGSTVRLTWSDNSTNEAKFSVERRQKNKNTYTAWQERATPTSSPYTESPGTGEYQYRVRAVSSIGVTSAYSNVVSARVR